MGINKYFKKSVDELAREVEYKTDWFFTKDTYFRYIEAFKDCVQLFEACSRNLYAFQAFARGIKRAIRIEARDMALKQYKEVRAYVDDAYDFGHQDFTSFARSVRHHDWYADFADDSKVARRAHENMKALKEWAERGGEIYKAYLSKHATQVADNISNGPKKTEDVPYNDKVYVVCAAIRCKQHDITIASPSHFDTMTHKLLDAVKGYESNKWEWEYGFIDSRGNFLTREEALVVAEESRQHLFDAIRHERLFSENLY